MTEKREIAEIAVYVGPSRAETNDRHGVRHEHVQRGDIVVARRPKGCIGQKERVEFVWLLVDGLKYSEMNRMCEGLQEQEETQTDLGMGVVHDVHEKRRFCVPFDRLKARMWNFNESLAMGAEEYQPCFVVDDRFGELMPCRAPLRASGLIFDKRTRRFL